MPANLGREKGPLLDPRAIVGAPCREVPMSDFSSHPTLSAHEILRFSVEQASMRVRHVGLHQDRIVISLRDDARQKNLWEIMQVTGGAVRLTRYPKLRPLSFDGPFGGRFEGSITPELFARVVAAHRPAIVAMVQNLVARLIEQRASASGPDEEDAADHRLREIRQVASLLFPEDFPG